MSKKAVFLDRDGVINKKAKPHMYVSSWEEFELLPGIIKNIKKLNQNNYLVIVITNQRGIARGMVDESEVLRIHDNFKLVCEQSGAMISKFYYCPHDYSDNCDCRKPKPGMINSAIREFKIDPLKSFLIGDSDSDIKAAEVAGVRGIKIKSDTSISDEVMDILNNDE